MQTKLKAAIEQTYGTARAMCRASTLKSMTPTNLSRVISGAFNPTIEMAKELCRLTGKTFEQLFNLADFAYGELIGKRVKTTVVRDTVKLTVRIKDKLAKKIERQRKLLGCVTQREYLQMAADIVDAYIKEKCPASATNTDKAARENILHTI